MYVSSPAQHPDRDHDLVDRMVDTRARDRIPATETIQMGPMECSKDGINTQSLACRYTIGALSVCVMVKTYTSHHT